MGPTSMTVPAVGGPQSLTPFERFRSLTIPTPLTACTVTQYSASASSWHAPGTSLHARLMLVSGGAGGDDGTGGGLRGGGSNGGSGGMAGLGGAAGGAGGGVTVCSGRQNPAFSCAMVKSVSLCGSAFIHA